MIKSSEIKALRRKLGLTVKGFARAVGCSAPTVRNWESGRAVQVRYRSRLDDLDRAKSLDSVTGVVDVLAVTDWNRTVFFATGERKPLAVPAISAADFPATVADWLGAGVEFNISVAELTEGGLSDKF